MSRNDTRKRGSRRGPPRCHNGYRAVRQGRREEIREALERGEFDNLPGAGRPLDLEEYFAMPDTLRLAYSILKNANCVPVEVELLNEVARLERQLAEAPDDAAGRAIRKTLNERRTELAVLMERNGRR